MYLINTEMFPKHLKTTPVKNKKKGDLYLKESKILIKVLQKVLRPSYIVGILKFNF